MNLKNRKFISILLIVCCNYLSYTIGNTIPEEFNDITHYPITISISYNKKIIVRNVQAHLSINGKEIKIIRPDRIIQNLQSKAKIAIKNEQEFNVLLQQYMKIHLKPPANKRILEKSNIYFAKQSSKNSALIYGLYINPELIKIQGDNQTIEYIPLVTDHTFSVIDKNQMFINGVNANLNGYWNHNIYFNKNTHVVTLQTSIGIHSSTLYQINYTKYFQTFEASAGFLNQAYITTSFINAKNFLGVGYNTSIKLVRKSSLQSSSPPLSFFLPQDGRIVIKNKNTGRIIKTYIGVQGNNTIDTNNFPAGSYDLEVELYDNKDQLIQQQSIPFFKSIYSLVYHKKPFYLLHTGVFVEYSSKPNNYFIWPQLTSMPFLLMGTSFLITPLLENKSYVMMIPFQDIIYNQGFNYRLQHMNTGVQVGVSPYGMGYVLSVTSNYFKYFFPSLFFLQNYTYHQTNDPLLINVDSLTKKKTNVVGTLNIPISYHIYVSTLLRYNNNENESIDSQSSIRYQTTINKHRIQFIANYTLDNILSNQTNHSIGISFSYGLNTIGTFTTFYEAPSQLAGMNYSKRFRQTNVNAHYSKNFKNTNSSTKLSLMHNANTFQSNASVAYNNQQHKNNILYNGSINSIFGYTQQHYAMVRGNYLSGVFVNLKDVPKNKVINIKMNNKKTFFTHGGGLMFYPVKSFQENNNIAIEPSNNAFLSLNYDQFKPWTSFLGYIQYYKITGKSYILVLGMLVNKKGDALKNVFVQGKDGYTTNNHGYFQIQIPVKQKQVIVQKSSTDKTIICRIPLPKKIPILHLGTVSC